MANLVIEHGRLTADPEMRQTPNGVPVASFSIAVPRKYKKDEADFFDCVAWRKQAEFLCQYFTKGKWIEVVGALQSRTYTDKDGKNRKAVEIIADNVSFVGDKPKDEGDSVPRASAPPPPPQVDPFSGPAAASDYSNHDPSGFYENEPDDDGDLPF